MPILSSIIWFPIFGSCFIFLLNKRTSEKTLKFCALFFALVSIFLSIKLAYLFNSSSALFQFTEDYSWISSLNIYYALGVDGFSLPLILLTNFMTLIVIISAWNSKKNNLANYLATFLIMQGFLCGIFVAQDAILFYVFLEAMLIPLFFIIGVWGGKNRIYATFKFFLYTFLGSVFFIVAILFLHFKLADLGYALDKTFAITSFSRITLDLATQKWLFLAFMLAFAVKIPMVPLHTWLPDAHVEAPTEGSVILAAITLKVGGYGILRFIMPIVPKACLFFAPYIIALSLIAICYIGFIAIVQKNMKKLIAYSSISHMGFVTLGAFLVFIMALKKISVANMSLSIEGAYVQMISHGFISGALFLCIGILYQRIKSMKISDYGGVVNSMPIFTVFFMLFALGNIGLPGTSGFVGELLIIISAFKAKFVYALFAALILILGASYTLWMFKRVMFGEVKNQQIALMEDLKFNELICFVLLSLAILFIGVWPKPLLNIIGVTAQNLIGQVIYALL